MILLHRQLTPLNVKVEGNLQFDFMGDTLTKTLYVLYLSAPKAL